MNSITIKMNGAEIEVEAGLVKAESLYEKAKIEPDTQWLYLDKEQDIDIPLLPNDHIIIHGGENIFADDISPDIGENPSVRNPACPQFNNRKLDPGISKAKITGAELRKLDADIPKSRLFVDLSGEVDQMIRDEFVLVIQSSDCYFTIPVSDENDEAVDLEECSKADRKPPKGQRAYKIRIDGEKIKVNKQLIEGVGILALVGKTPEEYRLDQKLFGGRRKRIEGDEIVDLSLPGVERFETVKKQAQQGKDV